ncbi:MAG: pilus assembly protein [Chloroflexi bacterium]|nr:pilus assembly protein [Chloroflexota bacterium]
MLSSTTHLNDPGSGPARRRGRGQALVELAVVLPILLLVAAGIWELGRTLDAVVILTNASREGVRIAARGATADEVRQRVKDYLTLGYDSRVGAKGDIIFDASKIEVDGLGGPKGDPITVRVPAQVRMYLPLISGIVGPVDIGGQTTMRLE